MASKDPDDSNSAFQSGLTRKLLLSHGDKEQPKRISNEAVLAAGELLRIFVLGKFADSTSRGAGGVQCNFLSGFLFGWLQEARHRAGIEAECEQEAGTTTENMNAEGGKVSIRADHITKVAAELLMDFS
jgi:hypothetical protein